MDDSYTMTRIPSTDQISPPLFVLENDITQPIGYSIIALEIAEDPSWGACVITNVDGARIRSSTSYHRARRPTSRRSRAPIVLAQSRRRFAMLRLL